MLDVKKQLVTALSEILPTHYELYADSTMALPCITYLESQNSSAIEGDTLGYSNVTYNIKLWGRDLSALMPYAQQIDTKMRDLGYSRNSFNELEANGQICMLMIYQGLGHEYFNN